MSLVMTVGDLVEIRFNFDYSTNVDRAMNVLHYRIASQSGAPPQMSTALSTIASELYDKFAPLWAARASDLVTFRSITAQNVFPLPRSVATTFSPTVPVKGAIDDDAMPLQDAPTLLKTTEVGQRWGLGRLFYVGLAESQQGGGQLDPDAAASLLQMAQALDDSVAIAAGAWAITIEPVLVRGPSDNPVSLTKITGGRLSDLLLKTQRRRRPGKGS